MHKHVFLLLLTMSYSSILLANEVTHGESESNTKTIQLSVISRTHELEFLDRSLENYVILKPNIPYVFQASFIYNNHLLTLETENISDIGVNDNKGVSSYYDIEYTYLYQNSEYRAYYSKYEGFYVSDQKDSSGNYFTFEDLATSRIGFEYKSYGTQPKMISVNNRYSNDFKKLPDAFGTFEYGVLFDVSNISNFPSSPDVLSQIDKSEFFFFNDLELITISPFVGGLGRIAIKSYFIEGGLSLGFGIQSQKFTLDAVGKDEIDYSFVGSGFISLGKTILDNSVLGLSFSVKSVEPSVEKNEFAIATVDATIFYRINF